MLLNLVLGKLPPILALIMTLGAIAAIAEPSNFGILTLSHGFSPSVGVGSGIAGGAFSLSSLAQKDTNNNKCLGFASPTPDHLLVLQQDFAQLTIQINSRGRDTTLLVMGPDNQVFCGDDTGSSKDARVSHPNWKAGTYRIWVGSIDEDAKLKYSLSVGEN
jgi:hypothetical protein